MFKLAQQQGLTPPHLKGRHFKSVLEQSQEHAFCSLSYFI